jgi:tRNA/rRNA methyltransferase
MSQEKNSKQRSLERFGVVLVRPQGPRNIGAVARALCNMGLSRLVLVAPQCDPRDEEVRWMARDGWPIAEKCSVADSLDEALKDFHLAVGTTARRGSRRGPFENPSRLAARLVQRPLEEKIALVFGPEDRGLESEDLARCQEVVRIPTDEKFSSLNLAQAVLILAYELFQAEHPVCQKKKKNQAPLGLQEEMFRDLEEVLSEIGYLNPQNPGHIMLDIRRMLGRAELTGRDVKILRGMVRQIRWAANREK